MCLQNFFVLTAEPEFGRQSSVYDFEKFYINRLDILELLEKHFPKRCKSLLIYYNDELFDVVHPKAPILQAHEIETNRLLELMNNQQESDSEDDNVEEVEADDDAEIIGEVEELQEDSEY